jgi:hypothetical protein
MKHLLKTQLNCLTTSIISKMEMIIAILIGLFAPIAGIMFTVGLLILIDTVIGIWKARKLGEKITSRGFSKIISKMLLYQGTIMTFFLVDRFILGDILSQVWTIPHLLTKVVGLVLASVEIFSIDENYRAIKKYGLWDAAKRLLSRAKEAKKEIKDFDLDDFKNN